MAAYGALSVAPDLNYYLVVSFRVKDTRRKVEKVRFIKGALFFWGKISRHTYEGAVYPEHFCKAKVWDYKTDGHAAHTFWNCKVSPDPYSLSVSAQSSFQVFGSSVFKLFEFP